MFAARARVTRHRQLCPDLILVPPDFRKYRPPSTIILLLAILALDVLPNNRSSPAFHHHEHA